MALQFFKSGQTVPFGISLDDASSAPSLIIRRLSDGYCLDFATNTFKNSGWTTKSIKFSKNFAAWYYLWDTTGVTTNMFVVQYELSYDGATDVDRIAFNYSGGATLSEMETSPILAKESSVLSRLAASNFVSPDNAGIATLLSRVTPAAVALWANTDVPTSSRASALQVANLPTGEALAAAQALLEDDTIGLSALRTLLQAIPTSVETRLSDEFADLAAKNFPTTDAVAQAVLDLVQTALNTAASAGTMLQALTVVEQGTRRFTADALKKVIQVPQDLAMVVAPQQSGEVIQLFQVTKPITPPDPSLGVVAINVYQSLNLLSEAWDLVLSVPYEQGTTEITFQTSSNGFYRFAFVAEDGDIGTFSDPFPVNAVYDLSLTYALDKESETLRVGDQKYVTINVTERDNKAESLPMAKVSIFGPIGSDGLVPEVPEVCEVTALCDKMQIKYMVNTDLFQTGVYHLYVKVFTGFEVLQNLKPLKFKIIG